MINNVTLVGRVANDLEIQKTADGQSVLNFRLALDSEKEGQPANFIPCQVWDRQAENMVKFVSKGGIVGVQGRLSVRKYESNKGEKRTFTQVIANRINFMPSNESKPKPKQQVSAKDSADWIDSFL